MKDYDVLILGGGIAGLTAAIYTTRAKLRTLVLEKKTCGGLANWAIEIENFPSHEKIGGMDLMNRVKKQVVALGADIEEIVEIAEVNLHGGLKVVETDEDRYQAGVVIIASGREPIPLPVEIETEHLHYCAICDGTAYRDKDVLVVGGGNSGVCDALYLLNQGVRNVLLVEQAGCLFAEETSQECLLCRPDVTVMTDTEVAGGVHEGKEIRVTLRNTKTAAHTDINVSGLFVYVGQKPNTDMFSGLLELDTDGYIVVDDDMRTNVEGVFAAGDVRRKKYRQLTTAMNDGTIAALSAVEYIRSEK